MAPTARFLRYTLLSAVVFYILYTFQGHILRATDRFHFAPIPPSPGAKAAPFVWRQLPVRYPVTSLTPLPTGSSSKLPKVQFDFPTESASDRDVREERQNEVKTAFSRCWNSYKSHAWMADELKPVSAGVKDNFGGWAATLVDSLDTLWILGMKQEFEDAAAAAVSIDFSASTLHEINVFETTIRYLGGFLAAYDLSGEQRLLDKAIELGNMLLVAFDTPNRMPITRWKPEESRKLNAQMAHDNTLAAEIGSLTMEFTRLSQVTGDLRWFDAVDRVMRLFDAQQAETQLPGMWPIVVNAKTSNFTSHNTFTLGAMSDSLYEYLPKMHALLGGQVPMYSKMYHDSMSTAIKHSLFRPMVPDSADILLSGSITGFDGQSVLDHQGQHLVCFAGGMFALGGRLLGAPQHVEIGQKLTDGCIWTYKALPLGIMPEVFYMSSCPSLERCEWNESAWKEDVRTRSPAGPGGTTIKDIDHFIKTWALPPGFTSIPDTRYILRPEAIESVFILYRITGRKDLLESAWVMFQAIQKHTRTSFANAAIADVTLKDRGRPALVDSMESFWLAETLKYFYLIFSEPDLISLDEYVFNTEAHPFLRPTK